MVVQWFDLLYLINLFCVWFSWRIAMKSFSEDCPKAGYLNIFASALNAAIIANHFINLGSVV
jgi:hypothetical protein